MKTTQNTSLTRTRSTSRGSLQLILATHVLALVTFGCADDSPANPPGAGRPSREAVAGSGAKAGQPVLLEPPARGRGEQFTMKTEIAAGDEREKCLFVRTREPMIVNHDEMRFTAGSHHVLLFTTTYPDLPTEDLHGTPVDTSGVFDCSEGVQGFWSLSGLVAVSQSAEGQSAVSFPKGVGMRLPANTLLLFNAHYINPTEDTLKPEIFANLHAIPESELEQEGGLIFWYNPFLKVPARGSSMMRASCPLPSDVRITNAQSHMHRRGVGYRATLISPANERTEIYTSDSWEDVPVKAYAPNLEAKAGSRLEWSCEYTSSEDHAIYQGPRSTDEMCMFIGSYYPVDGATGFCARGKEPFLAAEWSIGTGTASCGESLNCISAANSESAMISTTGTSGQSKTSKITDCLVASKPSAAAALSAALGCLGAAADPMNPVASCGPEVAACAAEK